LIALGLFIFTILLTGVKQSAFATIWY